MAKNKSMAAAANLANMLPTGTVLAFQAFSPSFTNNGDCFPANKVLILALLAVCSLACFLSSFTDSFRGKDGKLYYGIATFRGLYVFNDGDYSDGAGEEELDANERKKYKITFIDFVHAFASVTVFLVFSLNDTNVQSCLISNVGANQHQLMLNLPIGATFLASFLFTVFPTRRRGIGYGDAASRSGDDGHGHGNSTQHANHSATATVTV